MNGLGRLNLTCLSLESINNSDLGRIIKAAKFPHLNEIVFTDLNGLWDLDVRRIARSYGQQVMKLVSFYSFIEINGQKSTKNRQKLTANDKYGHIGSHHVVVFLYITPHFV
jgi:hypothetical protein